MTQISNTSNRNQHERKINYLLNHVHTILAIDRMTACFEAAATMTGCKVCKI
jgi:hypothetical protein